MLFNAKHHVSGWGRERRGSLASGGGGGEVEPAEEAVIETMSFRTLGYLLTRKFYPRKICSQQAEFLPGIVSQAASVPAAGGPSRRSLHSLRDLSAGKNAYGPLVTVALAGGLGIGTLIFKKHPDDADNNVTDKEVRSNKPEVTDNKPMQMQATNMEKRDVDMEAKFHKWMKWMDMVYPNQEEETRRFELFKERVNLVGSLDPSSLEYLPNQFADRTDEEIFTMIKSTTGRVAGQYQEEALLRWTQKEMLKYEMSTAAQKN